MNSAYRFRGSWFGIALVIIGAALLLDRFDLVQFDFSTIFWPLVMLLGLVAAGRGFSLNKRGKIFWGTIWFLYGLFFYLRSADFVDVPSRMLMASSFLIFGVAFFMIFLNNIQDWVYLIPATILSALGVLLILARYDLISYWELRESIHLYWPIALILFGVGMILRRRTRDDTPLPPPPGTMAM